ncbi:hypothetical protein MKW94_023741 [Papaver nudicaule]|uniref:TraB family protein n=1 Tax=Papaver nudicaule TaxID=74823 RepID=A0AA41W1U3_PAPNU|nr:hypothetical protein [Papaver nudicaule]
MSCVLNGSSISFPTSRPRFSGHASPYHRFRVSFPNSRARFSGHNNASPYHDIPGIPTDGKVVLLKNSKLKSKVYLVGTVHTSKQSAETVKKVINYIKPNVVAVELCEESANEIMKDNSEDIAMFALSCWYRKLQADGIFPGLEFKVAMEESSRMRARCVPIDEDQNVTLEKVSKVLTWELLLQSLLAKNEDRVEYTRSSVQEMNSLFKKHHPELFKAVIEDRDKFMFKNIRTFKKKAVAVVGMAHMDGIETLWKHAEMRDNKQPPERSGSNGKLPSHTLKHTSLA